MDIAAHFWQSIMAGAACTRRPKLGQAPQISWELPWFEFEEAFQTSIPLLRRALRVPSGFSSSATKRISPAALPIEARLRSM